MKPDIKKLVLELQEAMLWAEISNVNPEDEDVIADRQRALIENAFRSLHNDCLEYAAVITETYGQAASIDPKTCGSPVIVAPPYIAAAIRAEKVVSDG